MALVRRENKQKLSYVYSRPNPPASFGGVRALKRYSGRLEKDVRRFLSQQDAYMLHKPTRIRFPRRKTYSKGIRDFYQVDLVDVSSLSSFNNGMRFILVCIDVFNKKAFAVGIKTNAARDVTQAFERIISMDQKPPTMTQSNKGTKLLNLTFQVMLRRHGILFYTSENEDLKASVVERFNRTLKTKMYRHFTYANPRRYVDDLDDLVHSYNNTYHRSIRMAPVEVGPRNEDQVRARLYPAKPKSYK